MPILSTALVLQVQNKTVVEVSSTDAYLSTLNRERDATEKKVTNNKYKIPNQSEQKSFWIVPPLVPTPRCCNSELELSKDEILCPIANLTFSECIYSKFKCDK